MKQEEEDEVVDEEGERDVPSEAAKELMLLLLLLLEEANVIDWIELGLALKFDMDRQETGEHEESVMTFVSIPDSLVYSFSTSSLFFFSPS